MRINILDIKMHGLSDKQKPYSGDLTKNERQADSYRKDANRT